MSVERFSLLMGAGLGHLWVLLWFLDQPSHRVIPVFCLAFGWLIVGFGLFIGRKEAERMGKR